MRKRVKARPLEFGTIAHEMIEYSLEGKDPFKRLSEIDKERGHRFRSERELYGDIIADASAIMEEYFEHWRNDGLRFDKLSGRRSELQFTVEIAKGIELEGKIDGISVGKNKLRWLVEHKTFTNLPSEDERWRNIQSAVYLRVIDMMGLPPVDGTLWDYIRSRPPSRPKKLKSGTLSKKSIDTLPSVIFDTLTELRLPVKDYAHMMESAMRNRERYFQRIYTPVKPVVVDAIFSDFVEVAKEMADCHGKRKARSIGRHCTFCDYEPLCRAELQGYDTNFIRSKDYESRSRDNNS